MPLYEYRCDACGHKFEQIQLFSDPLLTVCEECGGALKKLISSPAFQLKGSGWYASDYPKLAAAGSSGSGSSGGDQGSSGEKSGDKSEGSTGSDSKGGESKSEKSEKVSEKSSEKSSERSSEKASEKPAPTAPKPASGS